MTSVLNLSEGAVYLAVIDGLLSWIRYSIGLRPGESQKIPKKTKYESKNSAITTHSFVSKTIKTIFHII